MDQVVADADVYQAARGSLASRFADGPAAALRATKAAIDEGLEVNLDTGLEIDGLHFAGLFATEDQRTGMRSLVENGPGQATFAGRWGERDMMDPEPTGPTWRWSPPRSARTALTWPCTPGCSPSRLGGSLPPGVVTIERDRSVSDRMRGRPGEVSRITVRLGDRVMSLAVRSGQPLAEVCREVRGVVLSRQQVQIQEWAAELARGLVSYADRMPGCGGSAQAF